MSKWPSRPLGAPGREFLPVLCSDCFGPIVPKESPWQMPRPLSGNGNGNYPSTFSPPSSRSPAMPSIGRFLNPDEVDLTRKSGLDSSRITKSLCGSPFACSFGRSRPPYRGLNPRPSHAEGSGENRLREVMPLILIDRISRTDIRCQARISMGRLSPGRHGRRVFLLWARDKRDARRTC